MPEVIRPLTRKTPLTDTKRLHEDLPLIRALAVHAIEHEFGVKTPMTVYREHLYELSGFKTILGTDLSRRLSKREAIDVSEMPKIPNLSVCLKYHEPLDAFENLTAQVLHVRSGRVGLLCRSRRGYLKFRLRLNVPEERLEFEWSELSVSDDESEMALRDEIDRLHFVQRYLANGILQVVDATSGELLGRRDAYLPVNIMPVDPNDPKFVAQVNALGEEADRRRGKALVNDPDVRPGGE